MNIRLTNNARSSAAITAIHIPLIPSISGSIIIIAIWNTNILRNDTAADTAPLLSAVKNHEVNILSPLKRYATEYILIASVVSSSSSLS